MRKSRFFTALICTLLFALLLSACSGNDPQSSEGTDESTSAVPEETEPAPATLKFSEGGKCEFYIVYPYEFDDEVKDIAINLRKQISKYIGVELKMASDEILDKPVGDFGVEHQYEILLGTADREESKKVTDSMRSRDYAVTYDGDKIVLAGLTLDTVEKACERFINDVIIKQGKSNVGNAAIELTEENKFFYTYGKYSIGTADILGSDLGEYRIVYSKSDLYSAERTARLFGYYLSNNAGYMLNIKTDSSAKDSDGSAREIIFGVTSHGGDTVETKHGFSVRASGNKIYASAECYEGYTALLEYLKTSLFVGEKVEIADGFSHSGVAVPEDKAEIEGRAGEYRVIFNNVHGAHVDEYPIETRNQMQAELHYEYLPDVIGLQENAPSVASYLAKMRKFGYTQVPTKPNNSNNHDYTAMLYNADRLELVEYGYHLYNDGAGDKSKAVTWGVFKDKSSGDIFAVGSTHFYWTSDDLGKSARLKDAEQLLEVAKTVTEKYNCPMIVGGDYNCNINSDPIKNLYAGGFENLQKLSPDSMDITTHHAYAPYDHALDLYLDSVFPTKAYSSAIDHALVYNKSILAPKMFRVILHDYSLLSSDHCPVMVDFDIN